jgi:hypothetical protein
MHLDLLAPMLLGHLRRATDCHARVSGGFDGLPDSLPLRELANWCMWQFGLVPDDTRLEHALALKVILDSALAEMADIRLMAANTNDPARLVERADLLADEAQAAVWLLEKINGS